MQSHEISKSNLSHKILKYPFHGKEKRLIDKFLIIGFDFPRIQKEVELIAKKLINNLNKENINYGRIGKLHFDSDKNQYSFNFEEPPIVLIDISSDYNKSSFDNEQIIDMIYPKFPKSYVRIINKENKKDDYFRIKYPKFVVFNSNPQEGLNSKRSFNCIAFNYYKAFEKDINNIKISFLFPISFCILSEYPFFYSFYVLLNQIKELFSKNPIDVPLEFIIYNMVAFTPSPINHIVTLNIVPIKSDYTKENDLFNNYEIIENKSNSKKNDFSNYVEITFPILSGYPLMQFNLLKVLFYKFSPQDIIEIFISTILEKDIIFFSGNLEHLNLLMYSFINLNYPLNDGQYYWINVSVSYDTLREGNSSFVGKAFSSILGVYAIYDSEKMKKCNNIKDHIIVDVDKGHIIYSDKNDNLKNMIKKLCKNSTINNKDNDLNIAIKKLNYDLDSLKSQYQKGNSPKYFLEYDDQIKNTNKKIQEGFYNFIITISLYFYKNLSFMTLSEKNNHQINDNSYMIIFDDKSNIKNYTQVENYFLTQMKETMKFNSFVLGFIQSFDTIDLYKIPLSFLEEFITMKLQKNKLKKITKSQKTDTSKSEPPSINHLDLIDIFYDTNIPQNEININFNQFESYYHKVMEKKFNRYFYLYRDWQVIRKEIKKKNGLTEVKFLQYKYVDLNPQLLSTYIHYLNNLSKEEISMIFPLYNKLVNNQIKSFDLNKIENLIEEKSIEENIVSRNDMLCYSIIMIFILSIQVINIDELIFMNTLLYSIFKHKFIIFRKYYSLLIDVFYRLTKDAELKKKYKIKFKLLNFYYPLLNKIRENIIIPNENLLNSVKNFENIENLIENNDKEEKEDNPIDFDIFNQPQKLYYFTNKNKNIPLGDNIDCILRKQNQTIKCNLIDVSTLFKMLSQMVDDYINNLDPNAIDSSLMEKCIVNAIFYIEREQYFDEEKMDLLVLLVRILIVFTNKLNINTDI